MNNRILVLGATGNIGSFLVDNLLRKKADFIGGVPAEDAQKLRKMDIPAVETDFADPASLDRALHGIDTLFMLVPAAVPMLDWGGNIIAAAKRNGVRFILRSSIIDGSPDSNYLLFNIHGKIDQMLRESGIPCAFIRPNSFMQNYAVYYQGSINEFNSFSFIESVSGVSYVDVRDVAAVDAEILVNPSAHRNREYVLTGPEVVSYDDVARILTDVAGRTIRFIPVHEARYAENLRDMGMGAWDIDVDISLQRHIRDGRQELLTHDVPAITGRDPVTFRQFATDYVRTWQKQPAYV